MPETEKAWLLDRVMSEWWKCLWSVRVLRQRGSPPVVGERARLCGWLATLVVDVGRHWLSKDGQPVAPLIYFGATNSREVGARIRRES